MGGPALLSGISGSGSKMRLSADVSRCFSETDRITFRDARHSIMGSLPSTPNEFAKGIAASRDSLGQQTAKNFALALDKKPGPIKIEVSRTPAGAKIRGHVTDAIRRTSTKATG
jgi:hypothetical protein